MRRLLTIPSHFLMAITIIALSACWPIVQDDAGADTTAVTCSASGTVSYSTATITDWSVTCSNVPTDAAYVIVSVPITGGEADFEVQSADEEYDGGTYALPSSFTVGDSGSETGSYNDHDPDNPTDDSSPTAPYGFLALEPTGSWSPLPPNSIGYINTSGGYDSCAGSGTSCGTPDATAAPTPTDSISDVFASTQTNLLTEIGYASTLVVALLLIGLGVRMLVKWARKGTDAA